MQRTSGRNLIVWFQKSKPANPLKKRHFLAVWRISLLLTGHCSDEWKKRYFCSLNFIACRREVERRGKCWKLVPKISFCQAANWELDPGVAHVSATCWCQSCWEHWARACVWKTRQRKCESLPFIALTLTSSSSVVTGESECWGWLSLSFMSFWPVEPLLRLFWAWHK